MTQTYTDPTAVIRLAVGLCPECGWPVANHDGSGGPDGCSLTDNGVAQRIHAFQQATR